MNDPVKKSTATSWSAAGSSTSDPVESAYGRAAWAQLLADDARDGKQDGMIGGMNIMDKATKYGVQVNGQNIKLDLSSFDTNDDNKIDADEIQAGEQKIAKALKAARGKVDEAQQELIDSELDAMKATAEANQKNAAAATKPGEAGMKGQQDAASQAQSALDSAYQQRLNAIKMPGGSGKGGGGGGGTSE